MGKPRFLLWKTRAMATATLAWEHFGGNPSSGETASPVLHVSGGRNLIDSVDHSLVSRCLDGDEAAWEDLVRQYTRQVYGLCFRFTNSTQEAQDLTQDVFLRVFKTIKTFRSAEGSFHTWLARVTRNLLIDHYRRTRQERVTDSIEEQLPMLEERGGAAGARPDQALAGRAAADTRPAGSGDFAGFAGNGIPGDCGSIGHPRRHGEKPDQPRAGGTGPSAAQAEAGGMNCAELEELICDYVDGTLTALRKAEVARHLEACPACAEGGRRFAAAVAFMERAADVEPPPQLITRILFDAPWTR